jgi:molecular chaperone DnaK (HSP70)/Tfp pilus assembly protein PilF
MNKHIEAFIGIDYGTTSCKLAYITPPLNKKKQSLPIVENISFNIEGNESSKRFPSSVLFEVKNSVVKTLHGYEVTKLFKDDKKLNTIRYELVNAPKLDLGNGIFYPIAPPEFCEPLDLVSLTLNEMLKEFEQIGIKRKNCKIIVTVPSSFGVQQRKEMLIALDKIGVPIGENILIDEPNAALLGLIPSPLFSTMIRRAETNNILLMDFGGGTCDISLLKINEDFSNEPYGVEIQNLSINDYAELGGNKIDYELAKIIMDQIFHPNKLDLFNEDILKIEASDKLLDRLAKTIGLRRKEIIISELISKRNKINKTLKDVFTFNIEKIKIMLKSLSQPFETQRQNKVHILDVDFDKIIKGKIRGDTFDIDKLVNNVIDKAGLDVYDIGVVLLAGGSSRIFQVPKYRKELLSLFPHLTEKRLIFAPDPDLLISTGAAIECYNRFYLGKSLIRPICPSNIGVKTAENEFVCLIPAGKGLPFPNQEERGREEPLYVPNKINKTVKVPLYIEKFRKREIFEIWDITLPQEINPNDKLLFTARMKLDKTLEVNCISDKDRTVRFKLTSENWLTNVELTQREKKINDLRLKIKTQKKKYNKLQFNDVYDLIWEEYSGKYYQVVRKRCLNFLEADIFTPENNACFYNLLGLIANVQKKYDEAIQFYKKAKELSPNNSIFSYNVGVSYLWNTNEFDQAEKYLSDSLSLYSRSYTTHFYLAEAKSKNGKENEAKEHLREALLIIKEDFAISQNKNNAEYFCKICDRLKLEYPEELKQRLADPSVPEEKNIDSPINSSDEAQLIRLNPEYK